MRLLFAILALIIAVTACAPMGTEPSAAYKEFVAADAAIKGGP